MFSRYFLHTMQIAYKSIGVIVHQKIVISFAYGSQQIFVKFIHVISTWYFCTS